MGKETKIIIGGVIGTVIILGGSVWFLGAQGTKEQVRLEKPLAGEAIPNEGADHIPENTTAEYKTNPPTSGPHYASTQAAGIYENAIPDGKLIHSMEHGAVILWYKSAGTNSQEAEGTGSARTTGLSNQDIEKLKQIFNSVQVNKKIMVPRDSLDTPIALTSWGRLLKLQSIDEAQITNFMETNEDRAPEKEPI